MAQRGARVGDVDAADHGIERSFDAIPRTDEPGRSAPQAVDAGAAPEASASRDQPPDARSIRPSSARATVAARTADTVAGKCSVRASTGTPRRAHAKQTEPDGLRRACRRPDRRCRSRRPRCSAPLRCAARPSPSRAPSLRSRRHAPRSVSARDAEHLDLGLVRIRDEAPIEPGGAPGDVGDRARDEPAGARFGGRPHRSSSPRPASSARRSDARSARCEARSFARPRTSRRSPLAHSHSPAGRGSDRCTPSRSRTSGTTRWPARCRRSPADRRPARRAAMPRTGAKRKRASRIRGASRRRR